MGTVGKQSPLDELIRTIRIKHGTDFSRYRKSCVGRRISHRMSMLGYQRMDKYLGYLKENPNEMEQLLNVLTIHVTGFFRDNSVFETLAKRIFPWIIDKKLSCGPGSVRIWSAGCSTGEETYSIAMQLVDRLRREKVKLEVEIFGTDISEESCRIATKGVYPEKKLEDVPRLFRTRYFEVVEEGYGIAPEIRSCVEFKVHDLFSPPPYLMLDLIVCRNVLIHFNQFSRNRVMFNFHSALDEDGVLLLGKSEAVTGGGLELFELINPRNKIYRKRVHSSCDKEA
ncbi:MAG: protein-glutamate O-methyltransferase CheR [bacterium]|nr:MAG: protein-glutamate O-methyltransferase CheR [bacterium]